MGLRDRAEKGPSERWTQALEDMPASTRLSYERELRQFLEYVGETPEGLTAYWSEIMTDPNRNMGLSDAANDYFGVLDKKGYTGKQDTCVKAIKKFFKVNGFSVVINTKSRSRNEGARAATKMEIKTILAYAITNPRNGALVASIKDNGLRPSDLIKVTVGDVKPLVDDPGLQWLVLKIPITKTKKQKRKALPCFGVDATKHLRLWMVEREKLGLSDDKEAPLFVNLKNMTEYTRAGSSTQGCELGSPMSDKGVTIAVNDLCKQAGLPDLSTNSLRKFNSTALTMAGAGEDRIRLMHGKAQRSSEDSYLDAEAQAMLKVYMKYYDALSLEDGDRELEELRQKQESQNGTVEALRKQVEELTRRMESIAVATTQIGEVKDDIEDEMVRFIDLAQNDPDQLISELKDAQEHPRYKKHKKTENLA